MSAPVDDAWPPATLKRVRPSSDSTDHGEPLERRRRVLSHGRDKKSGIVPSFDLNLERAWNSTENRGADREVIPAGYRQSMPPPGDGTGS
jgi:hypothetical protein